MATQRELAKHLGTNEHRVRDLRRLDVLTASRGRAGYDLDVARIEYIRWLEEQARGAEAATADWRPSADQMEARTKDADTLLKEQARLAAERAEKLALENAQIKRELAPIMVLQTYAEAVAGHVRANLESIPAQCKREIPHLRAHEIAIIKREITRTSDAIADFDTSHEDAT